MVMGQDGEIPAGESPQRGRHRRGAAGTAVGWCCASLSILPQTRSVLPLRFLLRGRSSLPSEYPRGGKESRCSELSATK